MTARTKVFWSAFFKGLRSRGLAGVTLVTSDHHLGLKTAIESVFIGAAWATLPGAPHAQPARPGPEGLRRDGRCRGPHDLRSARRRAVVSQHGEITRVLRSQFPDVADMPTADTAADLFAFTTFPQSHWRKNWSTI